MPGPENGWWGDWTLIGAPPLAPGTNSFCLHALCLPWMNEETETGSAQKHPHSTEPSSLFIFLLNDSSRLPCPGRRMNDREDYTFESRFLIRLLHRGSRRGRWGCYYFPFIEEKIEACKCLMWGLMCGERERSILYSSSTDGRCWSDVLSPSAGQPVWSCLCMCPGIVGTTNCSLAEPNMELLCLSASNNKPYFTLVRGVFLFLYCQQNQSLNWMLGLNFHSMCSWFCHSVSVFIPCW